MSDWTEGYVAEIPYTFGYYSELNPLRLAAPFLNVALAPPAIATACELGFGQGISANIHAAATDTRWYGTDFNPAHAAFAQSLAAASGAHARLFDQSFGEFCGRAELPDFDFIGLHGIWSWVSEQNQNVIVDFVRRKLKPGGVLYISYNTQPGHAAMVPLRHLLATHAEIMAPPGNSMVAKIDAAIEFTERLLALNPLFALAHPSLGERFAALKGHDRHYLAHEYFNHDWRAVPFAEMAQRLAPAKLTFACSAHYPDHIDALNLSPEQQRFVAEIPDPVFRQELRDFIINQQFRRDYWVKGGIRLSPFEQAEAVRRLKLMLLSDPRDVEFTVQGAAGQRELNTGVYRPILDVLADRRAKTIGEIEAAVKGPDPQLGTIFEAVMVLIGKGDLAPVQDDDEQARAKPHTDKFNLLMQEKARGSGDLPHLATPVTGGGVAVTRFLLLFLLARRQGSETPEELARVAWDILGPQGHRLVKDGERLESAEANLAELVTQATDFIDKRLPVLQALQVA
ncbi:MAG TPA: methyltransferase regulatory domain-containing protein [Stellaceae bacterium]|nr:methyltransferase regulatory domain-containing protein [Stellaceae bacterium]